MQTIYSTTYFTDDCSHQRSLTEWAKKWNYHAHFLRINCGITHTKAAWDRQIWQVYRVYIIVQLGHRQNNSLFSNAPIFWSRDMMYNPNWWRLIVKPSLPTKYGKKNHNCDKAQLTFANHWTYRAVALCKVCKFEILILEVAIMSPQGFALIVV